MRQMRMPEKRARPPTMTERRMNGVWSPPGPEVWGRDTAARPHASSTMRKRRRMTAQEMMRAVACGEAGDVALTEMPP